MPHSRSVPRSVPRLLFGVVVGLLLATGACGGDPDPVVPGVDRETFVATYVDLRLSALGAPTGVITDAERERVLQEHGVTEEGLLAFAEAWGSDPERMKAVWEEVQRRLRAAAGEDTTMDRSGGR